MALTLCELDLAHAFAVMTEPTQCFPVVQIPEQRSLAPMRDHVIDERRSRHATVKGTVLAHRMLSQERGPSPLPAAIIAASSG